MKIVWKDNFARDSVADKLVADNITVKTYGETMLAALRETCTDDGGDWFDLVEDDYVLSRGMEDLV